jgi:hypothetical protein
MSFMSIAGPQDAGILPQLTGAFRCREASLFHLHRAGRALVQYWRYQQLRVNSQIDHLVKAKHITQAGRCKGYPERAWR